VNREDFDAHVRLIVERMTALEKTKALDADAIMALRALEAVAEWTANGKNMTEGQKNRLPLQRHARLIAAKWPAESGKVLAFDRYIRDVMPTDTSVMTRSQFDAAVPHGIDLMTQLIADVGPDRSLISVQRQLEAIREWTADGKNLTESQKNRLTMGWIAVREMEDFDVAQDLVLTLSRYIKETMPSAGP
jgi:hypothetical protein